MRLDHRGQREEFHFIPVSYKASGAVETEDWLDVIFFLKKLFGLL